MKSPVTAIEVRWRLLGDTGGWQTRRYVPGAKIEIREIDRATDYEVEARALGVGDLASEWVAATVTVPATNRTGSLALPPNVVANQPSMWGMDTSVTYEAESDGGGASEATISVSAGSLISADVSIPYAASSASISGEADEVKTIYLYYDDPRLEGGSKPLGIADNIVDTGNVYGRIPITRLVLTFPPIGQSGGGGGGVGGGGGGGGGHQQPGENQVQ